MNGSATFRALVAACGLSQMFAANAMARAVARVAIQPDTMVPSDLPRVIPEVERAIRPFLGPTAVARVLHDLHGWAASCAMLSSSPKRSDDALSDPIVVPPPATATR